MRKDDWCSTNVQSVVHCGRRSMRQVDDDTQSIHLFDHQLHRDKIGTRQVHIELCLFNNFCIIALRHTVRNKPFELCKTLYLLLLLFFFHNNVCAIATLITSEPDSTGFCSMFEQTQSIGTCTHLFEFLYEKQQNQLSHYHYKVLQYSTHTDTV